MSTPLLLGIDLGTSSVKALCVTVAGEVVGSGSAEPMPSNIFAKIGTMKVTMPSEPSSAITSTITG